MISLFSNKGVSEFVKSSLHFHQIVAKMYFHLQLPPFGVQTFVGVTTFLRKMPMY